MALEKNVLSEFGLFHKDVILMCKNFFLNFFLPKHSDFSAKSSEESIFHGPMALQQTVLSELWLFIATSYCFGPKNSRYFRFSLQIRENLFQLKLCNFDGKSGKEPTFWVPWLYNKTLYQNLDFLLSCQIDRIASALTGSIEICEIQSKYL